MKKVPICIIALLLGGIWQSIYAGGESDFGISVRLNGLRDGDAFFRYPISFVDTVSEGDGALWDLSEVEIGRRHRCEISLLNDSSGIYRMIEKGDLRYFHQNDECLNAIGFENNLWGVIFDTEETYLTNGMAEGMVLTDDFKAAGVYCDKLRYAMRGTSQTGIDASGSIILPEGDTITNVMRVHSRRRYHAKYYPLDSVRTDIADDEYHAATTDGRLLILDQKCWYAAGFRYPLMEMRTLIRESDGEVVQRETCYSPIDAMNEIEGDYENLEVRNRIVAGMQNPSVTGGDSEPANDDKSIDYKFTQNRAEHSVTVEYSSTRPVSIEFILADAMGIVYDSFSRQCEPGETGSITISYDGATGSGSYVVYICTDENRYAEKFYR